MKQPLSVFHFMSFKVISMLVGWSTGRLCLQIDTQKTWLCEEIDCLLTTALKVKQAGGYCQDYYPWRLNGIVLTILNLYWKQKTTRDIFIVTLENLHSPILCVPQFNCHTSLQDAFSLKNKCSFIIFIFKPTSLIKDIQLV